METVLSVKHWNEHLFSFRISRPASFRFRSGEFVMIGLKGDNGKPLLRAYYSPPQVSANRWAVASQTVALREVM